MSIYLSIYLGLLLWLLTAITAIYLCHSFINCCLKIHISTRFQLTGGSRNIILSDRKDLPYVDAVIHEVMRIVSIFTVTVQHCARESGAEIGGYQIPQKCHVVANLYAAMHDPEVFPEPDVFRPERFLAPDGQVKSSDTFLPFGMGK